MVYLPGLVYVNHDTRVRHFPWNAGYFLKLDDVAEPMDGPLLASTNEHPAGRSQRQAGSAKTCAPAIPSAADPHLGGAGQGQGDKVERPTGRTTLSPWPWPARHAWVGGRRDGSSPTTHSPEPFGNSISESSGPRRRHSSNPPSPSPLTLPSSPPLPSLGASATPHGPFGNSVRPMVTSALRGSLDRRERVMRVLLAPVTPGLVTGSPTDQGDARGGAWGSGRLTFRPGAVGGRGGGSAGAVCRAPARAARSA